MKKVFSMIVCAFALTTALFAATASSWVSAKKVELKNATNWFAKTVATAAYGDEVTVITVNGDWAKITLVSDKNKTGWVPAASLTQKKIVASSSGTVSANAKEISLAGKGFSTSLEDSYEEGGKVDYTQVNNMEKFSVSDAEAKKFLLDGSLKGVE